MTVRTAKGRSLCGLRAVVALPLGVLKVRSCRPHGNTPPGAWRRPAAAYACWAAHTKPLPRLAPMQECCLVCVCLQKGSVEFDPQLPANQTQVFEALGQGSFSKLFLKFDEAFWDADAV